MMSRRVVRFIYLFSGIAILSIGTTLAAMSVPHVRQGITIVLLKATGSLPDIGWTDLYKMSRSERHFDLSELAKKQDAYAAIQNPYSLPSDIAAGGEVFRSHCSSCHGSEGSGGSGGPSLRNRQMVTGSSDLALFRTITYGIRGTGMPPNNLPWRDKWRLVAYVRGLMLGKAASTDTVATSNLQNLAPVSYENILAASQHEDEWLTYSGDYDGQRFSPISQVTPANIRQLHLVWMREYTTSEQSIETTPLVVDGYMFVTVPPNRVQALDAATGSVIWTYNRNLPGHLPACCGIVNRGLAVLGDTLFLGTMDAHLVALDIRTGSVLWDLEIADYRKGYSITSAPLALKNLVVTGVAGGEYGIRGFVDARDATTGKEVWRFYTVPRPGESGADTWEGNNSWETGGGPTWLTGSYDSETNTLFWPTGNPSPNYDGKQRAGNDLYTDSVLALNADKGTLRWYFQFTPHDVFDWDATEPVVLFDEDVGGKRKRYLAQGDRNGFYYLLDREAGTFILARPFAKETWAKGIDSRGRPILNPGEHPTEQGTVVYPATGGATNWMSPSYSPMTGFVYLPSMDWGAIYYEHDSAFHEGKPFVDGYTQLLLDPHPEAAVRAVNAVTGRQVWEYRNPAFSLGGLLSTGGGVVFGSEGGMFFALDAKTGRELWHVETNRRIAAAPITFLSHGKQMVTIAAGHDLLTFGF
jgi:alcohol dehydrogenase (cytochrome c)